MADDQGKAARDVIRVRNGTRDDARDELAVEAPLELRCAGDPVVMVMRTPGHDEELACGLLMAEGVVLRPDELTMSRPQPRHPAEAGNVLELGLDPEVLAERMPARALQPTASCGVCGKTSIAALELRARPVHADARWPAALVADLPARLRAGQALFARTGGLHAAGLFDPAGQLVAVREDVGRHNAVDKVVGWAARAGKLPLGDHALCVSGRLSFEIVQKAVVAQVGLVVAVSAPSSLAVDLAERFRVTLCGFTRNGGFNVYSHGSRIHDGEPPR